jgi:hypothetical protein
MAKKPAKKPKPPKTSGFVPQPATRLQPTVTIGGAPAGYASATTQQPTVTIGGAPAGYTATTTPNFITGAGIPGSPAYETPIEPNFITGTGVPEAQVTPSKLPTVVSPEDNSENIDAFAMLTAQLRQWKLDALADSFIQLASQGFKPQEAMNKIKYDSTVNPLTGKPWNADYNARFSGNVARAKQGLNVYTENEYLTLEDSYADTIRRNNINNLLSADPVANQKKFAGYMEKGLSATEFASRIDTFFERVENMNPNIKKQFTAYFPGISNMDIVSYLADPENTLPILNQKIAAAEIGASALQVGLAATSRGMAQTIAGSGITAAQTRKDYEEIGGFLSDAELYSNIYRQEGINYNQETAEKDIILGDVEAGKKRKRLASMARAGFEGSSGRARTGQPQTNSGMF